MRRIAVVMTTLALTGLMLVPVASAQYYGPGTVPMNQTATSVTFAPGSETLDPTGSVVINTAVIDATVMGSPINGTLRIEEVRTRPVDAGSGSVQGQFTFSDGIGNGLQGDLSGTFTMTGGSTNASGQFTVRGGTGPFTAASGSGTFTEVILDPGAGGGSIITFTSSSISMNRGAAAAVAPPYNYNANYNNGYNNNGLAPQPGYVGLPGYSNVYVESPYSQAQAQAQAAAAAAAAQAQPQVIFVPVPESEWDPNGVYDRPARSSSTNRNYR